MIIDLLFLLRIVDISQLISLIGSLLASDGQVESPLRLLLVLQGGLILLFILLLYQLKKGKDQKMTFLTKAAFLVSLFFLVLQIIFYEAAHWNVGLFAEDNILENMTAILQLASSLFFLILIIKTRKKEWLQLLVLILLFFSTFFIGMEEISWGQRIFGLKTPEYLSTINKKEEINVHNILREPFDDIIYYGFYMILGLFFMLIDPIKKKIKRFEFSKKIDPFFPPADYFYFGILIYAMLAIHHYVLFWEVYEQILSVIIFIYAVSLFRNWTYTRKTAPIVSHSEERTD